MTDNFKPTTSQASQPITSNLQPVTWNLKL
jgi:hypothetical protein